MGMGNILDLNITNIPRKLGLWLVENFDPRSFTLQLQNGQSIHITAADVAATLGLPMGQIEITKRAARMVNGYVNQNYIGHLHDVDNIPNLNWCQLVINSLVASKISWQRSADKIFGGPIVFLTVFYADRVVLYRRTVPRSYPAFRSWTFKLLSMRQQAEIKSGGFGFGYKEDAYWGNPDVLKSVDEIVRAVQKRIYLNDIPSFSLGLTQEEQTHSWDDINAVAREYGDAEQRQEGDAVEVNVDGCEAELGEEIPQAAERPHISISRNRELFRFQSRVILWEDMLLLKPNAEIPTSIIDAWAAILNDNEEDRLSSRFFASTWTTVS
nr:uncharacterized protein LOC109191529 [Ipomoea batatas]